jgi:hypothetical protein
MKPLAFKNHQSIQIPIATRTNSSPQIPLQTLPTLPASATACNPNHLSVNYANESPEVMKVNLVSFRTRPAFSNEDFLFVSISRQKKLKQKENSTRARSQEWCHREIYYNECPPKHHLRENVFVCGFFLRKTTWNRGASAEDSRGMGNWVILALSVWVTLTIVIMLRGTFSAVPTMDKKSVV